VSILSKRLCTGNSSPTAQFENLRLFRKAFKHSLEVTHSGSRVFTPCKVALSDAIIATLNKPFGITIHDPFTLLFEI